jgi:hypothetical protein
LDGIRPCARMLVPVNCSSPPVCLRQGHRSPISGTQRKCASWIMHQCSLPRVTRDNPERSKVRILVAEAGARPTFGPAASPTGSRRARIFEREQLRRTRGEAAGNLAIASWPRWGYSSRARRAARSRATKRHYQTMPACKKGGCRLRLARESP